MLISQAESRTIMSMLPLIGMIVVSYFLFISTQQKKTTEQQKCNAALEKGEVVVTGSGIVGKINKIEYDVISLQLNDKTFIKVMRSAISKEMTDALDKTEHGRRI